MSWRHRRARWHGARRRAVSPFFVRRTREHGGDEPRTWTHWLKWLIVIDVDTQALVTQEARRGPYNDSATLRPMIDAAHAVTPIMRVLADAEFDSELNHQHVRALGATSVIPAKRGKPTWRFAPTIAGIRGGRDEVLERGVEYLSRKD